MICNIIPKLASAKAQHWLGSGRTTSPDCSRFGKIEQKCPLGPDRVVFNHHSRRRYNDGAANHEGLETTGPTPRQQPAEKSGTRMTAHSFRCS